MVFGMLKYSLFTFMYEICYNKKIPIVFGKDFKIIITSSEVYNGK